MMKGFRTVVLGASVAVICILNGGCSSKGGRTDESKNAVDGIQRTRNELAKGKAPVQHANAALDRLSAGGNLEQAYSQYVKAIDAVKAQAERTRARAQDMRTRQRQYIASWEKEIETL